MFSMLIYFFGHPIYFAQLHHVNPLCKHNQENLQRKESSDQKMQENKPVLELKNTKEKVYQNMWMHLFWFYPRCHCALLYMVGQNMCGWSIMMPLPCDQKNSGHKLKMEVAGSRARQLPQTLFSALDTGHSTETYHGHIFSPHLCIFSRQ